MTTGIFMGAKACKYVLKNLDAGKFLSNIQIDESRFSLEQTKTPALAKQYDTFREACVIAETIYRNCFIEFSIQLAPELALAQKSTDDVPF